jgi:hypothetical protein
VSTSELVDTLGWQLKAIQAPEPKREYQFHPKRKWRFDMAWPDKLLAVEVDGGTWIGGRHTTGSGIEADSEKFSEAAALGWRVMRLTKWMVLSGTGFEMVERALAWPGMLRGKEDDGMGMVVEAEVVYILTEAGQLHAGLRLPNEHGVRTFEADNLDDTDVSYSLEIPEGLEFEAFCKRCFNGVSRANRPILV